MSESVSACTSELPTMSPLPVLAGRKSLSNLGTHPDTHASVRRVFAEALSAKAVLELQPIIENALAKRMPRWEKAATSGEVRA